MHWAAIRYGIRRRNHLTSEEYIEMITLKTAVFLGMALQLGAIIGGASTAQSRALYDYGTHLGIAFQIQDDLLDLIGDQNQVGKTKGGDILRKKKTILITKALEIAPSDTKKQIMDLLNSDTINADNKVNQMIELLDSLQLFDVVKKKSKGISIWRMLTFKN
jgi:geranylgeranyl diphosphate synthase type II